MSFTNKGDGWEISRRDTLPNTPELNWVTPDEHDLLLPEVAGDYGIWSYQHKFIQAAVGNI